MNDITVSVPDDAARELAVEAARMDADVSDVVAQAARLWLVLENPEEVIDESNA